MQSRKVFDIFQNKFGENKLDPILLIVQTPQKSIMTNKNIDALYDLATKLKKDPRVEDVKSIVSTDPRLSKAEYKNLYVKFPDHIPDDLKKYLEISTKGNLTVMTVLSKYNGNTPEVRSLIKSLRGLDLKNNLTVEVTGGAVNIMDVKQSIARTFPYALMWIMGFTYLILLIFLRSVVLPFKAIFTTVLSLCASYGVLVLVFQQGYFHELLNFDPQGMLDISLLIIIFCALFGVSMDYEVFLLTRIKEYYEKTGDNIESIISGIERSSKIITSAAIIVIMICFSFMAADVLIVKAFGLGIAVAVFVDAFIIRTVFVPATMALLGKWNWYLPKWLDKILPQISFDPEHYPKRKNIK
jgi:RND superfamily putative drug exporter